MLNVFWIKKEDKDIFLFCCNETHSTYNKGCFLFQAPFKKVLKWFILKSGKDQKSGLEMKKATMHPAALTQIYAYSSQTEQ